MTGTQLAEGLNFRPTWVAGSQTNGFRLNSFYFTVTGNSLVLNYVAGLIVLPGTLEQGENTYPWVEYKPGGTLVIPVGSALTIEDPVVMNNNSTTTVNGRFTSPGGFTVQGGSVLTGAGTLIGSVINSGLLNPGNPTGQMTIQGNFTQTPSGTTGLQVAGPNTFSQLFITGTSTLAGTLQVTAINGYALQFGDKYQFLTARGGISGEYDNIDMPSGYRGRFLTSENNTKGSLLVAPESYTQMAATPNQRRVAKALDAFITAKSGDRETVSIALDELSASEYSAAFEAIMPSLYASLPTLAFNQANALNTSMFQRMWMQRINGTGFSTRGMQAAALQGEMGGVDDMQTIVADPERMRNWGVFVDGNGIFATANSAGVLQDYKSQSGGVAAGASYKWNENFSTGVYVGYQGLQAQYDNDSRVIDNAVRFGGFGTLGIGGWYLNGLVGGAWHTYDVDREIEFGAVDRTARGNPDAGEFDLALATGYDIKAGNFTFGPVTSMQYTYVGVQGFRENGADSLNLDVDPYNSSSLLYSLGAQVAYRWEIGKNFAVTPMLSASWQHEFLQNAYPINAGFNTGGPASPFMFQTSQPQQDYFMGGAGVGFELGDTWDVSFFWNAVAGNADLVSQNIYLSIGAEF
jgi:outer membrane autotransporter protein